MAKQFACTWRCDYCGKATTTKDIHTKPENWICVYLQATSIGVASQKQYHFCCEDHEDGFAKLKNEGIKRAVEAYRTAEAKYWDSNAPETATREY